MFYKESFLDNSILRYLLSWVRKIASKGPPTALKVLHSTFSETPIPKVRAIGKYRMQQIFDVSIICQPRL